MRNAYIHFSIRKNSGHLAPFFNVIIRGTVKNFAMQNPRRPSNFGCVSKPEMIEGAF